MKNKVFYLLIVLFVCLSTIPSIAKPKMVWHSGKYRIYLDQKFVDRNGDGIPDVILNIFTYGVQQSDGKWEIHAGETIEVPMKIRSFSENIDLGSLSAELNNQNYEEFDRGAMMRLNPETPASDVNYTYTSIRLLKSGKIVKLLTVKDSGLLLINN